MKGPWTQSVAALPWSPLARGRLTRDGDTVTARTETDDFGKTLHQEGDRETVDAVTRVTGERDVPRPGSPSPGC